ncbi:RluA family pseudouridine synthase [Legionella impletisoli]|uniref:Pseudouridine synthase n=1 Tax=Legionella impletisoli TaxID=343510 RepID=A0A917JT40_9GAMM|nr:RluA family pseudouridine synthase [Legionella impletisoli]GGI85672.1 pseudouridine synthase [Legionella impletisoli]
MSGVHYKEISPDEDGQRLDNYLFRILKGVPKSHIYRLIRNGEVRINKKRAKPSSKLESGDSVRIPPVRVTEPSEVFVGHQLNQKLLKSILYEDKDLLIINKPAGIAVHGGSGLSLGVIEALRASRSDLPYLELAHRLDKETSGCLVLAKKRSVLRVIQAALAAREVKKIYWALLNKPWVGQKHVLVDRPLEKNRLKSGERMVSIKEEGKSSQTEFKLLENFKEACLVEAYPKTGRTHQIRVHSAYIGHPIAGDDKYGGQPPLDSMTKRTSRLYLHARSIQFNLKGETYSFQAELDDRFKETLTALRARSNPSYE